VLGWLHPEGPGAVIGRAVLLLSSAPPLLFEWVCDGQFILLMGEYWNAPKRCRRSRLCEMRTIELKRFARRWLAFESRMFAQMDALRASSLTRIKLRWHN